MKEEELKMSPLDKMTKLTLQILNHAQMDAKQRGNQQLTPFHILKSLLQNQNESLVFEGLKNLNLKKLDQICEENLKKIPVVRSSSSDDSIYLSNDVLILLKKMEERADQSSDQYISLDNLIISLFSNEPIKRVFEECGGDVENLKKIMEGIRMGNNVDSDNAESGFDALKRYTKDLTQMASEGKLDPVIGRDEEIRRTLQVLSRRTKNNPILIGEPGVGKTAIAEGLSQRIIRGDVPDSVKNKRVMSLDLGSLLAGAKYRGEFEERLKSVLNEISKSQDVILFIDEIHTLVGAGKSDGAMDASNMLKPALARGELRCVGSTTLDEYRQYIEKDSAFARRFQPVFVEEPSVLDSISILRGLKEKYELHHGVRISDSAVIAACTYSDRYISDRFLPDKAIDLMDEAASRLKMIVDSKPENIDELDRRITQLRIEREVLKKESDPGSKERYLKIEEELKKLEAESQELNKSWNLEKSHMEEINSLKEKIESARTQSEIYQRNGEFAKAGEILYGTLPSLEKRLDELQHEQEKRECRNEVTDDDIALVVSRWTGIPVEKMLMGDREKLLQIEDTLRKSVVGQDEAINSIADCIRRSRAGISDPNRPIGSFLFLGPTGVGKTELSKSLAQFLFDDRNNMIRIDMSEYMEKHSVARLIGAPPGYVGYEKGGELTEAVKRRPYSVVLFDEIEKAHSDVFNILLQVLDEGHLTDGLGRNVNFKNTIIILTSNLGAEYFLNRNNTKEMINAEVMSAVRSSFRPELINRLDEIIVFNSLSKENMMGIVDIQLNDLSIRLKDKGIEVLYDDSLKSWLCEIGYDPIYGARPLKRSIQKNVQDIVARMIISGEILDNSKIKILYDGNSVKVEHL